MNNLYQSMNDLKNKLNKIAEASKHLSEDEISNSDSELINKNFNFLDKLASSKVDAESVDCLLNDSSLNSTLFEISRFRKIYNIKLELERAENILKSRRPWNAIKDFEFYRNYVELANMEVEGANLKSGQKVIFLGSGPLPLSLIILCANYQLEGVGIEQKTEYVDISRNIINKLDMSDRIKIIHGNHFSLDSNTEADLIMIAAAAVPKDEIFSYLKTQIKHGTSISYRIYEYGFRKLLDVDNQMLFDLKEKQFSYLTGYNKIYPKPPVNNTCVFGRI